MTQIKPNDFNILLVDDEPNVRDYLQELLDVFGYKVELASDGQEALDIIAKKEIDLVLLDIMLPKISGIEVLRRLRQDYSDDLLPILMISAIADERDVIIHCIKEGANDQLPKNVDSSILDARIRSSLQRRVLAKERDAFNWKVKQSHEQVKNLIRSMDVIKKMYKVSEFVEQAGVNLSLKMHETLDLIDETCAQTQVEDPNLVKVKGMIENDVLLECQNFDRLYQQMFNINLCIKNMSNILNDLPLEKTKFDENIFRNLKESS